MRVILLTILLYFSFIGSVAAQNSRTTQKRDTLLWKNSKSMFTPIEHSREDKLMMKQLSAIDSCKLEPFVFQNDSLIIDSLHYEYTAIKRLAMKHALTSEIYRMLFIDPRNRRVPILKTENTEARFEPYKGYTINSISVKVLPPYGYSVYDTLSMRDSLVMMERFANFTHMKTSSNLIKKNLTVKSGMKVDPFVLAQNEILLRNLDYLEDVNIIIRPTEGKPECADLIIVCEDEFAWGAEVETNFLNSFKLQVENRNFIRLGHKIEYEIAYRGSKDKKWGNRLEYYVSNLGGTHLQVKGAYRNDYREKYVYGDIERPFLTSNMKWATGLRLSRVYYSNDLPDSYFPHLDTLFNYWSYDYWLGRSFTFNPRYSYNRQLFLTSRFYHIRFVDRPMVGGEQNEIFYNRMNYLLGASYRRVKYYKSNLIFDFGRTEIIPSGWLFNLTGGVENNEFDQYGYLGASTLFSYFHPQRESFYFLGVSGSTYFNQKHSERIFYTLRGGYISKLMNIREYKIRVHGVGDYVNGIKRYEDEYLYMDDLIMKGFSSDSVRGHERLSGSFGATLFFPFIKKGFRATLTSFVNAGTIAKHGKCVLNSETYWGIGATLRLRNDNIILKNLSISLIYYPHSPSDMSAFKSILSGSDRERFPDFSVGKPQPQQYR